MTQANTLGRQPAGAPRLLLLLLFGALVVYWTGNAGTPLWDRDEPRFAQTAREMLATGDYVMPRFQGEIRYDKPVLGYYFIAAGMRALGTGEFGARLFSGLFGGLSTVVLFFLARRMTRSPRTALYAAAALATAPVMFVESKLCTVDAALLFWVLLAFTGLWRIYEGPCRRAYKALFWAALALAVLTKGPVALAAVFAPVVLMAVLSRDRSFLRRMAWLWGILLFTAIIAPWVIAVQDATGGEFLEIALGRHVLDRARAPLEGHTGFPGFYVVTLFGTFFPWAFFLPRAVYESLKGFRDRGRDVFLISWAAGLLIVLELVGTKMVHYSLPAFPALAVLVAVTFERAREGADRRLMGGAVAAFVFAFLLAVGPAVAVYTAGMTAAVLPLAGAGVILVAGMVRLVLHSRSGAGAGAAAATMFAWLFVAAAWVMPVTGSYAPTLPLVDLAARAGRGAQRGAPVAALGYAEPSLVFYLGGDVEFLAGPAALEEPLELLPRVLVVSRRSLDLETRFPERSVLRFGTVEGFNFAKGRREEIDVFLDWGQ